ncbi:MAG: heparinase II/III family protein [Hyphomicrobiaceae bacterium]
MAQLTLAERARVARLAADRARRSAVARVLGSPLLRWRYGAPVADELLIVPQDLRTADASFADEIAVGHFGLAGRVAYLETGSPFDLRPPSEDWARELHGFSWLRHLRAAANTRSTRAALSLVRDWIAHARARSGIAWEPAVVGRRLISWIVNAPILLEGVDQKTYDRTADSLADQLVHLSATWRDAPDGYPRLLAILGVAYGELCIAGHERHLDKVESQLAGELNHQVLPDGGHASRNPGMLVELLLDVLPLRQCFVARGRRAPAELEETIARCLPMLRYMRLGDGTLARFNGMGAPSIDALATALAYDSGRAHTITEAPQSRFVRMERDGVIVIVDTGSPPPIELAAQAHAGCLSFELSDGTAPVFVNGGAPGPADPEWRSVSRATASHNTLCLADTSSSRLVRHPLLERLVGGVPIRLPDRVRASMGSGNEGDLLETAHNGYLGEFGLLHRRKLALAADGSRFAGVDRLGPPRGTLRLVRDLPFAIHFHLHPSVECWTAGTGAASLSLRTGKRWRFLAEGAQMSIEPSVHYADLAGPARSHQIVLRGTSSGETEVRWRLQRGDGSGEGTGPDSA